MSATRQAWPERGPAAPKDVWEARLVAEARRLLKSRGTGPFSASELDAVARDLLVLQRGLTGERDLIGSAYMDERNRLASYLLFYWPVSRAQVRGVLSMAFPGGPPERDANQPLRILDIGSGPAPCSIAAAEWFKAKNVHIVACDRSDAALESGRRLAESTTESASYTFTAIGGWDAAVSKTPDGPFDLIVLGHVLNELWKGKGDRIERRHDFMQRLVDALAPDGAILVLEPATLAASRDMLALRDLMASSGIDIRSPCFRNGPCPALENEGQSCHSDFEWRAPATVRELSRRTGLDKGLVKTAGFVFMRSKEAAAAPTADASAHNRTYRVVSEPMLNKAGRLRLLICGEAGRFPLSAKPGEGFPAESIFCSLRRSDSIELSGEVKRESGYALGSETKIVRVSPVS